MRGLFFVLKEVVWIKNCEGVLNISMHKHRILINDLKEESKVTNDGMLHL